jgi:predicted NBD/HSP70 family sugar kinase
MASKATHSGLKEHNRRLVLRAIFSGEADSRAGLAQYTGLTKPTVSDIVGDLMDEGFLIESGMGESTESGGKRPRLLEFYPAARQIIGVSIGSRRVFGVLANLDGAIRLRHYANLNGAQGDDVLKIVEHVINGLKAQSDADLLCIGIGTPGIVDTDSGIVRMARTLGWQDLPLADILTRDHDLPVYVGNSTELATRAQLSFNSGEDVCNLVMVVVNNGIEIGAAFGGVTYHHSGDLGLLRAGDTPDQTLVEALGWRAIAARVEALQAEHPSALIPKEGVTYLHLNYGYEHKDKLSQVIYEETAAHLGQVFAWIAALVRPDQVVLAGDIVDMGESLLWLAYEQAAKRLPPELLKNTRFRLAQDTSLSLSGTIAYALHHALGVV